MQRASRAIAAPSPPSVMQRQTHSPLQSELIAQSREESFLDRDVEIGFPVANRPEIGPTVESYFRAKAARGEFGQFFGLDRAVYPRKGFAQ